MFSTCFGVPLYRQPIKGTAVTQSLEYESIEGDDTFSPRRVYRIEIYDEASSSGPFLADLTNNQDTGAVPRLTRDLTTDKARANENGQWVGADHQDLYDRQMDYFSKPPHELVKIPSPSQADEMLAKINEGLEGKTRKVNKVDVPVPKITEADFKQLMSEYVFISSPSQEGDVRSILREESRTVANGYILHGIEGTGIIDLTCQTSQDSDAKNILMQDNRTEEEKETQKKQGIERIPIITIPTEIDIVCLGNPFIFNAQEFYVDLGTDTNLDGFYVVSEVTHEMAPGQFTTKFKLTPSIGGPQYLNSFSRIMSFIAGQLVDTD